jgi:rhodanese-related sulfurtransferase
MARIAVIGAFVLLILAGCATAPPGKTVGVPGGSYRTVTPAELSRMLETKDFFLVNVKVPYSGEIPKTDAFISYLDTRARLGDYPQDRSARIVVYCLSGRTSEIAARQLVLSGYTNVFLLDGGMNAWRAAGFKLIDRRE